MTDHDAAPVQQFLDVPVAQWEAVVQPDGVLDDKHGETVAVGLEVGQGGQPTPVRLRQHSPKRPPSAGVGARRHSPKAQRRTFTAAYKLKIIREAAACARGQTGALLRREGLYASQLTDWRQAVAAGLEPVQRGPKVKQVDPSLAAENKTLRKENARLNRRLQRAELILDIQKKVATLMGIPLATHDFGAED